MITTSWHRSCTRSSWWLENSTVAPCAARPDSSSAMALHGDRIQAGERLVEHQQVRLVHQGGDQLDPLLVAVRQRVQAVRRPLGQAEALQPGTHAAVHVLRPAPAELAEVDQLVPHPHPRIQAPLLRHVPEPGPVRGADRRAVPPDRSLVQLDQPEHRAHGRRLPAPFGPRKPVSRPGRAENVHRSRAVTGPNRFVTASKSSMCLASASESGPPGQRPVGANDPSGRDQSAGPGRVGARAHPVRASRVTKEQPRPAGASASSSRPPGSPPRSSSGTSCSLAGVEWPAQPWLLGTPARRRMGYCVRSSCSPLVCPDRSAITLFRPLPLGSGNRCACTATRIPAGIGRRAQS